MKLEPWSYVHRQIAMKLSNRSGVDVGPGVKLDVAQFNMIPLGQKKREGGPTSSKLQAKINKKNLNGQHIIELQAPEGWRN